jgi:DnaJ family protein A protein 2
MDDLYSRLGLERNASTEEIRRAYKDAARVKHPDRGGDPEEFKKIQEAHEILTDSDRRAMYDATGSTASDGGGGMGGGAGMAAGGIPFHFMNGMGPFGMPGVAFNMGDMFANLFGGGGGAGRPRGRGPKAHRGPNKHHTIGVTLEDFYAGKEIKLKFNQARRCGSCLGSGADATEQCGACSGTGVRTTMRQIGPGMIAQTQSACDVCNGEGTRIMRVCRGCNGKKFIEREKQLDIKLTPGMRVGEQLTFPGECSDSADFEEPGDVILVLQRSDSPSKTINDYEWNEDDLVIRKQISYAESVLGFSIELDHPSGGKKRLVWRGGPLIHGAVVKLDGGGMPKKGSGGAAFGNLLIQVMITPPPTTPWTPEQSAALQAVLGTSTDSLDGAASLTIGSSASLFSAAS